MSAFLQSGRSDLTKIAETTGRFRPGAAVGSSAIGTRAHVMTKFWYLNIGCRVNFDGTALLGSAIK